MLSTKFLKIFNQGKLSDSEIIFGSYKIVPINFSSINSLNTLAFPKYRPWINFLKEHNLASYAIKTCVNINLDMLGEIYYTLTNVSMKAAPKCTFNIFGASYEVDANVLNRILRFPTDNFVPTPSDGTVRVLYHY